MMSLILALEHNLNCYFFLLGANKSHTASSDDLQQFEMGKFTPSRNQFIPAFTEPISHAGTRKLSSIFTDLFMVFTNRGTLLRVSALHTDYIRKGWRVFRTSLAHALGQYTDPALIPI